ncbi:MAG TPA: GNAT family N-acetyltransferase [Rhizomicrobium sp.]|jgi:predicted GNAT family acetyltransferase|nr:GNAT family N-acetyltransferase [Rhizomicrobium sp.]
MPLHPLDRPVWHALTSRQAHLALGDARALRFDPAYGLFAAAADPADADAVLALVPETGAIGLVEAGRPALPAGLVTKPALCNQMIADAVLPGAARLDVVALDDGDAAEMLALATLTRPGPFFARTHRLGDFLGVKVDGRLAAMAGERLKLSDASLGGFTEVSGVCTHPDFRGRGFAGGLMRIVAERIVARGETPFLHVYADNARAIALYETLGFRFRTAMYFILVSR